MEQKQLLKATISSNVSVPRASFLVANHIVKAKKPFTTGEELIVPAAEDICCEPLGKVAVQKVARVLLLADTRYIYEITEDTEAQKLERVIELLCCVMEVKESKGIDNMTPMLVFV